MFAFSNRYCTENSRWVPLITGNIEMAAVITPSSHVQLAKEWLYKVKTQNTDEAMGRAEP